MTRIPIDSIASYLKSDIRSSVTYVYRKAHGEWRLAYHHTDLSEAMLNTLKRLSEAA